MGERVDNPCVKKLYSIFSNYRVQFADNFADWDEGSGAEGGDAFRSIEDIASYKARRVYKVTGLLCIASRTSFEVEPIRPEDMDFIETEAVKSKVTHIDRLLHRQTPSYRCSSHRSFQEVWH